MGLYGQKRGWARSRDHLERFYLQYVYVLLLVAVIISMQIINVL